MPRLNNEQGKNFKLGTGGAFNFKGARVEHLGATEYTLVTIAIDESGSVFNFEKELHNMLITSVEACKKSPRSENILVRVITFSSRYPKGLNEIHGFTKLSDIDTASYPEINPGGGTPLCDACYSAIGAMNIYGQELLKQDFGINGICFIITDGGDNESSTTPTMVAAEAKKAVSGETLESLISILIGINVAGYESILKDFQREAGIGKFMDAGEATPRKLAKLAEFVSRSVSSQSQALGTGGPSKNIDATI